MGADHAGADQVGAEQMRTGARPLGAEAGPRRRRGPRRADAAGTGPSSADGAEPRVAGLVPVPEGRRRRPAGGAPGDDAARPPLGERDRWLLEQRPPHWG